MTVEPTDSNGSADPAARLLGQLMRIARISALEEMASGIAHELNQPIGAIATFSQTGERMLNRPEPMVAETREILQNITSEALKAGSGIHRIRTLFQVPDAVRTAVQMGEVIGELEPVLQLLADRAGLHLRIDVQPALPAVSIDRLRIQHVVFSLVQNALEASGNCGVVRIEVSGDRYAVTTAISDSGAGVPVGIRSQLFRPFFTTKAAGTGLGLASSRAIVEAHEGSIGLEDNTPSGARFWFRLPADSGERSS
jgi:C4-dicarboxylate-specific signal transduction histidine kinase